ncbi:MAG: ATP-binding protein [Bacteroidia bacterium]
MVQRILNNLIYRRFHKGKAIILMGARQVGKTTLIHELLKGQDYLFLDGDDPAVRNMLESPNTQEIKRLIGSHTLVFVDEAQRIPGIGLTLKIVTDQLKAVQLLVSGSSSFDLGQQLSEPLTGRKWEYQLYPICWEELENHLGYLKADQQLEDRLIYGMYPDVLNHPGDEREILNNLVSSYLYRDILQLNDIRKPEVLEKLVLALALQVGSEVNYNELSNLVGVNKGTIQNYIELLEKGFVIFRLGSFSRNLRNEIKQNKKVYFYDNGLRNAVMGNFSPFELRADKGALWENFLASERIKQLAYKQHLAHRYFWRTKQQQEIDWVEEIDGQIRAWEFKWKSGKNVGSRTFENAYHTQTQAVNRQNFRNFVVINP